MNPIEYINQKFGLQDDGSNPRILKGISRRGLYQLFAELGYAAGCELGLERGKNAERMFQSIPNLKLYGVDPYEQHPQCSYIYQAKIRNWDDAYLMDCRRQAEERLKGKNCQIIAKFSEDAVKEIKDNSLDFVYIDGDHSYDFVMLDIILWGRKVKKGGIVSGHDYFYEKNGAGRRAKVMQAVNDYTKLHGIKFYITGEGHDPRKDDCYPSWLWVKMEDIFPNTVI